MHCIVFVSSSFHAAGFGVCVAECRGEDLFLSECLAGITMKGASISTVLQRKIH